MNTPEKGRGVIAGLTGVMVEDDPGGLQDFHGYLRVGGLQYKLQATRMREDAPGGRRRWALKLSVHPEGETADGG